jgi:hypothetical protein
LNILTAPFRVGDLAHLWWSYHATCLTWGLSVLGRVMNKKLFELRVYTSEGDIIIEQPDFGMYNDAMIIISPESVDTLIKWLQEAKQELNTPKD